MDAFVAHAVSEGYAGVECLAGIPGLVGATPIQNVGAYGQEVKDTVSRVRAYDRDTGTFVFAHPVRVHVRLPHEPLKTTGRYIRDRRDLRPRATRRQLAHPLPGACPRARCPRRGDRSACSRPRRGARASVVRKGWSSTLPTPSRSAPVPSS